jgi:transcriptional regulator with XRE-family HTH domain
MVDRHLRRPSTRITKILAENIRACRQRKNISQEKLAEICKLHRTYVGSVERGERNVTLSTLEAFSTALGISVLELLTERGRKK